jgi:DNA helicase HerA-like ATPase
MKFFVTPEIASDVVIGASNPEEHILLGRLAERTERSGAIPRSVSMDITKEFVSIIIGQRGSGKSFCLGSMLESLATKKKISSLGSRSTDRAALLFDPTGNFWTTGLQLKDDGSPRVLRQKRLLDGWGIETEDINCEVWLPAGYKESTDHPSIREFYFDTKGLDEQDWADILDINLLNDAQGILLSDVFYQAGVAGWQGPSGRVRPVPNPSLADLINCLENCVDFQIGGAGAHHDVSIRVLTRNLNNYARRPLFSGTGTSLTALLKPGSLAVLMMPYRVDRNLRSVITRVLIKKILRDREVASQIQNRLDLEALPQNEVDALQAELAKHIPRTVVALDEAQELLGDRGGREKAALEDFCLIGRNFGLSMILATQRPETNALSSKVRDQAGTWIIHQLASQANITVVEQNLVAQMPASIRDSAGQLDFAALIRRLETGQALVASKKMATSNNVSRAFVMNVRPRVRVHGGEAS